MPVTVFDKIFFVRWLTTKNTNYVLPRYYKEMLRNGELKVISILNGASYLMRLKLPPLVPQPAYCVAIFYNAITNKHFNSSIDKKRVEDRNGLDVTPHARVDARAQVFGAVRRP